MKKILLIFSAVLIALILSSNKTYATLIDYLQQNQTALQAGYAINPNTADCGTPPAPYCSTNASYSSSPCSAYPGCTVGANAWTKYGLDPNCYLQIGTDIPAWLYNYYNATCSIADKCGDSSGNNTGPYLNAGVCDCSVGGAYKTCCSGSSISSSSCVQQIPSGGAPYPPYDGVCPAGTTTVVCGVSQSDCDNIFIPQGYQCTTAACGAEACAGPATPPPSTPTPTPTPVPGQCPNYAPPATITSGSCPPNTTCVAYEPPAKADGSCTPGASCTDSCSFTCIDSQGNTCPATSCTTVWACDSAGSGFVNGGQYYYTCPASCQTCTLGQTRPICGKQNTCRAP